MWAGKASFLVIRWKELHDNEGPNIYTRVVRKTLLGSKVVQKSMQFKAVHGQSGRQKSYVRAVE
jgi:hypothetical protein